MSKIAYICELCWERAQEASCWCDRNELRVMPDGTWLCQSCFDDNRSDFLKVGDGEEYPMWSSLPVPPEHIPAKGAPLPAAA